MWVEHCVLSLNVKLTIMLIGTLLTLYEYKDRYSGFDTGGK